MGNAKGPSAALPQPDAVLRQHPAERDRGPALADEGFSRRHREPSPGRDGARPRLPGRCRGAAPVSASIGFGASGRLSAGPANTVPGRWYRRGRRFPGFRIFIGQGLQALLFFILKSTARGARTLLTRPPCGRVVDLWRAERTARFGGCPGGCGCGKSPGAAWRGPAKRPVNRP